MRIPPAISEPTAGATVRRIAAGRVLRALLVRPAAAGVFILTVIAASVSGCAKARAEANPAGPPLSVPAPPPRALMPVEAEPLAATPAGETPVAAVPRVTATPLPPRRPPTVKPEPERAEPPAVSEAPSPSTSEPRDLKTVPSPAASAADQARVEKHLKQAEQDRRRVVYAKLSADGKVNFDQSRRHSELAAEQMKEGNIPFALSAAEKAAQLAASLVAR